MTVSAEVIESLKIDLALEHGAILQYVVHGTQLRDAAITDPVRKIAREEMWHFEWLAEAIRDRGGEPTLDRADLFLPSSMVDSLREDVATEDKALAHYARTLELLGASDPALKRLIERIVDDERHHRARFERLEASATDSAAPMRDSHGASGPTPAAAIAPTSIAAAK